MFASLDILPPARRSAELRKLEEIAAMTRDDVDEPERRRIGRLRQRIIADFLAGYHEGLIRQKFRIGRLALCEIVKSGTTEKQRREVKAHVHRVKVREWDRQNKRKQKMPKMVSLGGYRSIAAAARAVGVVEQTARDYHRRGIPVERWRHTREEAWIRQRRDIAQVVGKFPSMRAAARAAGVSPTAARRYFEQGIPLEKWHEVARENEVSYQSAR